MWWYEDCPWCRKTGTCSRCLGKGCKQCENTGKCYACKGKGKVYKEK